MGGGGEFNRHQIRKRRGGCQLCSTRELRVGVAKRCNKPWTWLICRLYTVKHLVKKKNKQTQNTQTELKLDAGLMRPSPPSRLSHTPSQVQVQVPDTHTPLRKTWFEDILEQRLSSSSPPQTSGKTEKPNPDAFWCPNHSPCPPHHKQVFPRGGVAVQYTLLQHPHWENQGVLIKHAGCPWVTAPWWSSTVSKTTRLGPRQFLEQWWCLSTGAEHNAG